MFCIKVSSAILLFFAGSAQAQDIQTVPYEGKVLATKVKNVNGMNVIYTKYIDGQGTVKAVAHDFKGNIVPVEPASYTSPLYGKSLEKILAAQPETTGYIDNTALLDVVIALKDEDVDMHGMVSSCEARFDNGQPIVKIDSEVMDEKKLKTHLNTRISNLSNAIKARDEKMRDRVNQFAVRNSLTGAPELISAANEARSSVTLRMEKGQLEWFAIMNRDLILGIELVPKPANDLASAMPSSRVDPYALNYSNRGNGIGIYMSEGNCPDPGHIANYTRLSGTRDPHSDNVSAIVRGVSPESYLYCRAGYTLPSPTDLAGSGGNPRVHIETHSWGDTLSDNANYIIADRDFDNHVYNNDVVVFKSAGNFGLNNGYINSPGKALNVITVGNYDDSNDAIAATSSFRNSQIGDNKPEVVAPGESITAGGYTYWGTSQATPHAAGFAADLMSTYSWMQLKPYYFKAIMLAGATKNIAGGGDSVGVGALDFYNTFYQSISWSDEGANNRFSELDNMDAHPGDGNIDRKFSLPANKNTRVALVWFNRGDYLYGHRTDAHPIGMDLDLSILDPNGNLIAGSYSWDNPYEVVNFITSMAGEYTVRINRHANRDTLCRLKLGISVDWQ